MRSKNFCQPLAQRRQVLLDGSEIAHAAALRSGVMQQRFTGDKRCGVW
jgi:hypothetical protein